MSSPPKHFSTVDFCHILSTLKKHEFIPCKQSNVHQTIGLSKSRSGSKKIGVRLFFTNLRMSFVFLSVKIKSELLSFHAQGIKR